MSSTNSANNDVRIGVDKVSGKVFNRDMTTPAAKLTTTEAGVSRSIFTLAEGDYIWHRGAFRRVTGVDGMTVRMGRYALHSTCNTVEAAR